MRISDWSSDVCSSDLIRSIGFDLPPTEIKRAEMASPRFSFSISATDGKARTGAITMQRGNIRTPAFMPVATAATVKAMRPEEVQAAGEDIILGNTYHLLHRPGEARIDRLGDHHDSVGRRRPSQNDSG